MINPEGDFGGRGNSVMGRPMPSGWALAGILAATVFGSMVIERNRLDDLIRRPGPMSVTTHLPGLVHASATVVKGCLAGSLIMAIAGLTKSWAQSHRSRPIWGFISLAMPPTTPMVGALVSLATQELMTNASGSTMSRAGVLSMLIVLGVGAVLSLFSLLRRERPILVPLIGAALNLSLLVLFAWFNFKAPGFDQDSWAGR